MVPTVWSLHISKKISPRKRSRKCRPLSRLPRSVVPKSASEPVEVMLEMKRMDLSPITSKEIVKETQITF